MKQTQRVVTLNILGRDYQIGCPAEEEQALLRSAQELNRRMNEVKQHGAIVGLDRIAVTVALNLCYELQQQEKKISECSVTDNSLNSMAKKLKESLAQSSN